MEMENDATTTGVSEKKEEAIIDERADFIEALAEKAKQEMGEPEPEPVELELEIEKPKDQQGPEEKPAEELVEIVVDGESRKVPLSQILDAGKRTLQKQTAADKRLEEATRLLNEAKERELSIDARKKAAPVDDEVDAVEQKRMDYIHASQYGTVEEASAAMAEYEAAIENRIVKKVGTSREAIPTEDQIVKKVRERNLVDEIYTNFQKPVDAGGFSDLLDESFGSVEIPDNRGGVMVMPTLQFMTSNEVTRLLKEGSPNTWDTYKEAGEIVRSRFIKSVPVKDDSFERKRELKQKIDNPTPAKSRTSVIQNEAISDDDRYRKGFDEIAAARG